jgi:hypothetical protein
MDKEYSREVHVEIGGETRRVLLCLWGLCLAEEKGFDISEIELDEEEAQERKGNLKQMLDLLWIGMLPFNEELEVKDLGMQVGLNDMEALESAFEKIVKRQMTEDVREKIEEAQSGGEAEGKA